MDTNIIYNIDCVAGMNQMISYMDSNSKRTK